MKQGHYLLSEGSMPVFALSLAVLVLVLGTLQLCENRTRGRLRIAMPQMGAEAPAGTPVLFMGADGSLKLDGQALQRDDLSVRLQSRVGSRVSLVVRGHRKVPSGDLAEILRICNKAGFTNVAIEMEP